MPTSARYTMDADRTRGFAGCWQGVDISGGGIVALILCLLSVILFSISLGTNKWIEADGVDMGLFEYCSSRCERYVDNRFPPTGQTTLNLVTRTEATASFLILAVLLNFMAVVLTIFGLGRPTFDDVVWRASNCAFIGALCAILSSIILGVLETELPSGYSIGSSFSVNVAGWLSSIVAGILLSIDSKSITYVDARRAARSGGRQMI